MSEIKGQLLGIILVLMIFGVIGVALKGVFENMKDTVEDTVADITDGVGTPYSGKISSVRP